MQPANPPWGNHRSTQNVRIERVWRDVRKDSLEAFRQTFQHLEDEGLLDVSNRRHLACLYLVYQPRIQASLDRTTEAWNSHQIRTAGNRTPVALYELSRTRAINGGYWHIDAGDPIGMANDPIYGVETDIYPPTTEATDAGGDREAPNQSASLQTDAEIEVVQQLLMGIDLQEDDQAWGKRVFRKAVQKLDSLFQV